MNEAEDQIIDNFLNEICFLFPEVKRKMDSHDVFVTTSKMEEFANATTQAFSSGNIALAQSYLDYINEKLPNAHPKEFEFIDVYYVEHLFWQASQKTKEMGWPLVPTKLQSLYVAFHGKPAV
ncbi:hypothetical protein ACLILW_17785 [Shewanella baltica]|uniref:DUF7674 family protein n=1 Tax=Shewanella TaxID=22 RepID=UPI00398464F7